MACVFACRSQLGDEPSYVGSVRGRVTRRGRFRPPPPSFSTSTLQLDLRDMGFELLENETELAAFTHAR
jgi:hypothetical protein